MKLNQRGFTAVEGILVAAVVVIAGFAGWYVYHSNQAANKNYQAATNENNATVKRGSKKASAPAASTAKQASVSDFYSCWDVVGSVGTARPATCTYSGKTYTEPTSFDKSQIAHLDKVPAAAQALVISVAKKNFDTCYSGPIAPSQAKVILAQSNFVDLSVGCDSGHHEQFGLNGGAWSDLGGGQMGIGCETVDKYHITQAGFTGAPGSYLTTCDYQNATSKQIPR